MTPVWIAVIRVWIAIAFLLALCVVMAWFTMPARAQIACPPMPQLLTELQIRFKEFPLATADAPGIKWLLTASRDGTFTVIHVLPDGTGCIALSGAHFQLHQGT